MSETTDEWSIGELADEAGLTVRTLHHYDSIGLLRASGRTDAGHRRYNESDVRRLYEITALRQLGLSLAEIADVVDDAAALPRTIERHLHRVRDQLTSLVRLHDQLVRLTQDLSSGRYPDASDLINTMELTAMTFSFDQIVSRTGDDGTTGLADDSRVSKGSALVAAMGDVDELQSHLGVAIDHPQSDATVRDVLRHIQNDLFDLGADLAQPRTNGTSRLTDGHIDRLEERLRELADTLDEVPLPILPTGGPVSSQLHVLERSAGGRSGPLSPQSLKQATPVRGISTGCRTSCSSWLAQQRRTPNPRAPPGPADDGRTPSDICPTTDILKVPDVARASRCPRRA